MKLKRILKEMRSEFFPVDVEEKEFVIWKSHGHQEGAIEQAFSKVFPSDLSILNVDWQAEYETMDSANTDEIYIQFEVSILNDIADGIKELEKMWKVKLDAKFSDPPFGATNKKGHWLRIRVK